MRRCFSFCCALSVLPRIWLITLHLLRETSTPLSTLPMNRAAHDPHHRAPGAAFLGHPSAFDTHHHRRSQDTFARSRSRATGRPVALRTRPRSSGIGFRPQGFVGQLFAIMKSRPHPARNSRIDHGFALEWVVAFSLPFSHFVSGGGGGRSVRLTTGVDLGRPRT